jgi:hypothetical protein
MQGIVLDPAAPAGVSSTPGLELELFAARDAGRR